MATDSTLQLWGNLLAAARRRRTPDGFPLRPGNAEPPMSQSDLAEILGVNQSTVARWESGQAEPRLHQKFEIAAALGEDPASLFPYIRREAVA